MTKKVDIERLRESIRTDMAPMSAGDVLALLDRLEVAEREFKETRLQVRMKCKLLAQAEDEDEARRYIYDIFDAAKEPTND